jgi:hypothetical protein
MLAAIKESRDTLKKKVDNKEIKKNEMVDMTCSALKLFKDNPNQQSMESKIMLNTMIAQIEEQTRKNRNAQIDPSAKKLFAEFKETFEDKTVGIDPELMKKLKKDFKLQKKIKQKVKIIRR